MIYTCTNYPLAGLVYIFCEKMAENLRNLGRVSAMDQTTKQEEDGHPSQTLQSLSSLVYNFCV